jgi:hypothetical protein
MSQTVIPQRADLRTIRRTRTLDAQRLQSLSEWPSKVARPSRTSSSCSFTWKLERWSAFTSRRRGSPFDTSFTLQFGRALIEIVGAEHRTGVDILVVAEAILLLSFAVLVLRFASYRFPSDAPAAGPQLKIGQNEFAYTPHGEPPALHNAGRPAWGSGPRGEKPDYTGLDVIIVRGDRSPPSMFSSIQYRHETTECSRWVWIIRKAPQSRQNAQPERLLSDRDRQSLGAHEIAGDRARGHD